MKKILTILNCLFCCVGFTQSFTIDLSKNLNKTFSQTIDPQILKQIILTNKSLLSTVSYTIDVKKEHIPTPPIDVSSFLGGPAGVCKSIEDAKNALGNETDETKIPDEIVTLQDEIDKAVKAGTCNTDVINSQKLIKATTEYINLSIPIDIRAGDKVTVTITRDSKNKWTYVFETERINHGKIYYGFSYLFSNTLTSYLNYYSQKDTGSTYLITQTHNTNKGVLKNISPTFMYSYLFFKNPDAAFKFGLTGGFMLDLSNPSAVFSPSLIIGDNLSLNLGIALTQKDQLKGQYKPDQRITENLDFDQLHSKIWTYDMFFSIAFHFDKNPFKKADSGSDRGK